MEMRDINTVNIIINYSFAVKDFVAHKRATDVSNAEYIYNRYKESYTSEVGKAFLFIRFYHV